MKKFLLFNVILLFTCFLFTNTAFALSLGDLITIYDQKSDGSAWHGDSEDQEVEPGMVGHQIWDLEGFFLDGNILSMVGGFNFDTGESGSGRVWKSGDIFFDVDGTPQYGNDIPNGSANGNISVPDTYGYDYAIKFDFTDNTFALFEATATAETISSFYKQNYSSNPWQIGNGWQELTSGVGFQYEEGKSDSYLSDIFSGGSHNIIQLTLPMELQSFNYVKFTEQCGNDNLMGAGPTPAPEPATMLLFGTGLAGLVGLGRKRFIKK
jgi:hypothetical protein